MKVRDMPQLIVRAPVPVKSWLDKKAKQEERSLNWLICKILEEAMDRDGQAERA